MLINQNWKNWRFRIRKFLNTGDENFDWKMPDDEWQAISLSYTSGTTGPPKGALHSHRLLSGHIPGVSMSHNYLGHSEDCLWTPADWAWIGGLFDILMPGLALGVPVVAAKMKKFLPDATKEIISRGQVRNVFSRPLL